MATYRRVNLTNLFVTHGLNAGKSRRGELVSCFLLEEADSLNSINYNESVARQLLV